jgi:mannose-1-phosphate guanylyltransferase
MARTSNQYILILCGGTGPRLWPMSRASNPKQFLKLFGNESLIQDTLSRFKKFIPSSHIFIISNQKYQKELKKQIGKLIPAKNIIVEPEKKNTTMAIVYGAAYIANINPDAIITAAPSDHFIGNIRNFQKDIKSVGEIASNTNTIVTIGIKPTFPNPAFGYILPADKTAKYYPVQKFIEKPSVIDAQILIKKNAYWNSGIYTFSIKTLTEQLAHLQKDYFRLFQKLGDSLNKPKLINQIYKIAKNIPFDKAISENSNKLSMIVSAFQWSDVGEWQSIFNQLIKDKNGIAKINKNSIYISTDSKNCLISEKNNKLVGLVGLNNIAIIDTADSILICNLNNSFAVRDLVGLIVSNPKLKKYFLTHNDK